MWSPINFKIAMRFFNPGFWGKKPLMFALRNIVRLHVVSTAVPAAALGNPADQLPASEQAKIYMYALDQSGRPYIPALNIQTLAVLMHNPTPTT
mgnify:CR=1 FL=1